MKKWRKRKQVSENLEEQLLFSLGIKGEEEKRKFLFPNYEKDLYDPMMMLDMDKAVERILRAISKNEKIIIFGDFDADGVCASAIFYTFFKKIGFANFESYIPDRNQEGYGLNLEVVDEFIKNKVNLVVVLDCGINDFEEVEKAKEHGIDVVILDHHLELDKPPDAFAVVDAKQKKDQYPFKMLCGAGVAFKAVQVLIRKGGFPITPGWEKWLLDLVAIATIADMVPLQDENRILAYYGLKVLRKTSRTGLLSLCRNCGLDPKNIMAEDIAFTLAPRINIASRMGHANTSYALLTTESQSEADWGSRHLNELNTERKGAVEELLKEVEERINKKQEIIVEGDLSWNTGFLAILANKVLENYRRPVCLWGKGEARDIKGSCRSDGSVDLVKMMKEMPAEIFLEFGGHALAAGFSVKEENLESLRSVFFEAYDKVKKEIEEEVLWLEKELKLDEMDMDFLMMLEKFGPFGMANPRPVFLFKDLEIFGVKIFGNGGIHLQLDFKKTNGEKISAIGFFMSPVRNRKSKISDESQGDSISNGVKNDGEFKIKKNDKIDLAATVERNTYGGRNELRLRIIDLKVK